MAWQSPRQWATGEFLTAALLNEQLRENLIALTPIVGELKFFVRAPSAVETVIGTNWLECNGVAVSRSTYSTLYSRFDALRAVRGSGTQPLATAMDTTQTTLSIASYPTNWPSGTTSEYKHLKGSTASDTLDMPFLIQIDNEKMLVTSKGAWPYNTLTVVRGREGTLATSHVANATISLISDLPFGSGDGATTFNLPDLHGRVPWSAGRTGFHADVTTIGKHDRADVDTRRPRHRHSWSSFAAGSSGNQAPFAGGTFGAGTVASGHAYGDLANGGFGIFIGPSTFAPLDNPGYLVAGVWGIRFVGV